MMIIPAITRPLDARQTATGFSAEFVVDLELADEVEVSVAPHNI
jgi:hypothetical protein